MDTRFNVVNANLEKIKELKLKIVEVESMAVFNYASSLISPTEKEMYLEAFNTNKSERNNLRSRIKDLLDKNETILKEVELSARTLLESIRVEKHLLEVTENWASNITPETEEGK